MSEIQTFWWDERLAQTALRFLTGKEQTAEALAAHIGIDSVDALFMLRKMAERGRVVDVTTAGDSATLWLAAETPLA